jgi:hypothetical protein
MGPKACALLFLLATLALPVPGVSQAPNAYVVVLKPIEAVGEADPEFVAFLSGELTRAIEKDSDFRVTSGGPTRYYLKGQVHTDDKRHLVTLQLFDANTDRVLWLGNYDYRSVPAREMAEDVIEELYAASRSDEWIR